MTEHHVESENFNQETGKLGMWIFLLTELFLFGGLFLVYAVFRTQYSQDFHSAARELNTFIGTLNTVFLLTSSMTVAMSLTAIQKNNPRLAFLLVLLTLMFAALFMMNKYFEWIHKFEYHIFRDHRF